jgi:hypothetical protein
VAGTEPSAEEMNPAKRAARKKAAAQEVSDFDAETLKLVVTFGGSISTKLELHMAKQLWCSDLAPLIMEEQRKLAQIGLISKSVELKASAPPLARIAIDGLRRGKGLPAHRPRAVLRA